MLLKDQSQLFRRSLPIEFKFAGAEADQGVFTGYASAFGNADSYGEVVERGAFEVTLGKYRSEGTWPPLLWSHNPADPIGKCLDLLEDAEGLFLRAQLNLSSDSGREAFSHVKGGDVTGLSFGFRVAAGGAARNSDGTISLNEIDLMEISIVTMPANRRSRITSVKSVASRIELERGLRGEIPLSLPRAAAARVAAVAWPALSNQGPEIDFDRLTAKIEATINAVKSKSYR
jgi:HK97 family phage prohead protease